MDMSEQNARTVILYLVLQGQERHTLFLTRVEEELARGVHPNRIAFLAFTKKAAKEAKDPGNGKIRSGRTASSLLQDVAFPSIS